MLAANFNLLAAFFDAQFVRWVVWVGLVVLTITLLILMRTRWGQSQPLVKCAVLSLVAHLLLAIYISTIDIVTASVGSPDGKGIQVALVDGGGVQSQGAETSTSEPWSAISPVDLGADGHSSQHYSIPAPLESPPEAREPQRTSATNPIAPPIEPRGLSASDEVVAPHLDLNPDPRIGQPGPREAQPMEAITPQISPDASVPPPVPLEPVGGAGSTAETDAAHSQNATGIVGGGGAPGTAVLGPIEFEDSAGGAGGNGAAAVVPHEMANRFGDHTQAAPGFGATPESEAAVKASLKYLAGEQSVGGRWDARRLSGGAGLAGDKQDRQAAGMQADTAISGLILLSFLAAGHTHLQEGPYQSTVRHGLEFLVNSQDRSGNLGTSNNIYERMYSHAMATCALSEAYAMTRDERLQPAVSRAIAFTLSMQDRASGGWRYYPGQSGDTSQLGWQVMALKSGQLAGIAIPQETRSGVLRFLRSVADGRDLGLARYQPPTMRNTPATRSMTAEALVCRRFLGVADTQAATDEACRFLLQELPGVGETNHYYWYYGSLAMFQVQGEPWRRWNEALQTKLLSTQRTDGTLAGSWDPDPVWGGCGGRGYSTALATLCLEVSYRFLPLYLEAAAPGGAATRR